LIRFVSRTVQKEKLRNTAKREKKNIPYTRECSSFFLCRQLQTT
jgi:hypothetical protein